MTKVFAFECYADEDVFFFLRDHCKIALRKLHAGGQGAVIDALLVRNTAEIGLVDEDPKSTHHRERDKTALIPSVDTQNRPMMDT